MTTADVPDQEVADLINDTVEAASAFINGDMRRYVELIKHSDDYTLLAPFGGEPRRGFDDSDEALDATSRYFQGGEATVDLVQSYASGDLVVLVMMERQHGRIGGRPDQDLSLRVTLVFRCVGPGQWVQVHRHADPLVHPISEDRLTALARGEA